MQKYKILILTLLLAITLLNESMSCEYNQDERCCGCFDVSWIFKIEHYQNSPNYKEIDHKPLIRNRHNKKHVSFFDKLSTDEILSISVYLNPLDLRKLSITCSNLLNLINKYIWTQYNNIHNYKMWDLSLSPIMVSFAFYYYKTEKYQIAARFGHPKALYILRQIKLLDDNHHSYSSHNDGYYDYIGCFDDSEKKFFIDYNY